MTITAKYQGVCSKCGQPISVGDQINWERGAGTSHIQCPTNTPNTRIIKTGGVPQHLGVGDIWGSERLGVYVVTATESAKWRGEDVDVYSHIDTWYTIRPADETECALWSQAMVAADARRSQRKSLDAKYHVFNPNTLALEPTPDMTRRLDSYDDRWEPPTDIALTPDQIAIEDAALRTRSALRGHN